MKEMKRIMKKLMVFTSMALLFACGVTSNNSSSGGGSPSGPVSSIQTMSPGELARIQNQKAAELTPQNFDQEITKLDDADAIRALYNGLSDRNPAVRKRSEQTLKDLVNYDDRYLDELKKLQVENGKPDNWYEVSLILKDIEKAKAKAKELELKEMMGD